MRCDEKYYCLNCNKNSLVPNESIGGLFVYKCSCGETQKITVSHKDGVITLQRECNILSIPAGLKFDIK